MLKWDAEKEEAPSYTKALRISPQGSRRGAAYTFRTLCLDPPDEVRVLFDRIKEWRQVQGNGRNVNGFALYEF